MNKKTPDFVFKEINEASKYSDGHCRGLHFLLAVSELWVEEPSSPCWGHDAVHTLPQLTGRLCRDPERAYARRVMGHEGEGRKMKGLLGKLTAWNIFFSFSLLCISNPGAPVWVKSCVVPEQCWHQSGK